MTRRECWNGSYYWRLGGTHSSGCCYAGPDRWWGCDPIEKGEFLIVPHGVEHRPVAEEEVHILLFEPSATLNTGNVQNDLTVETLERI